MGGSDHSYLTNNILVGGGLTGRFDCNRKYKICCKLVQYFINRTVL